MALLAGALLAQVALTLFVALLLGKARMDALKAKSVRYGEIALSNAAWPEEARKVSNNFSNLFETPVLFYALVLLALHIGAVGRPMAALAWIFVVLRIVHSFIHVTSNALNRRFALFAASLAVLMAMTALLALKLAFGFSV